KAPEVPKATTQQPAQDIMLGDPKSPEFFILATVSTRGGGVRDLTLPKFQKADENGQPVFNADGSKTPLKLIEEDPVNPSFRMYHYPDPEQIDKPWPCDPVLGAKLWKVERQTTTAELSEVVLSCDDIPGYPGLVIIKTYSLKPREYHVGLTVAIHDKRDPKSADAKPRPFRYQLAGSHGLPIEGEWYSSVYRTPMIGYIDDRGNPQRDLKETQLQISHKEGGDRFPEGALGNNRMQFAGVATQYFASLIVVSDKQAPAGEGGVAPAAVLAYCRPTWESEEIGGVLEQIDKSDPQRIKIKLRTKDQVPQHLWFVLLPRAKSQLLQLDLAVGAAVFVSASNADYDQGDRVATGIRAGNARRPQVDDITVRVVSNVLQLEPGTTVVHNYLLYHGPSKVRLLAQFTGDQAVSPELVERYTDKLHLNILTDYQSAGFFGTIASKIMWTDLLILTTRFMHWLLDLLHGLVGWLGGGYGLSIILLTLLVRGAMFPVSRRSALLSQRMQALAPEMKKVQEKYKNDPQAKTAAVMELYRKHGVNPFGSCLPMIMQMPFFLGLYYCLQESIHFRLATFLWIDNLAAPDMLVYWSDNIPIISDPDNMSGSFFSFLYLGPYFNLLPVIAVALMLVQQKFMTPPPADEQQEMQQKMMKYMFIFIGIMFYKVAAGLCIYFIVSSLWGLCERKMLPKKTASLATAAGPPATAPAATSAAKPGRGRGKPEKKEKKPETTIQKMKDWWAEVLKQAQKK
ncbi:MAG TPA: membrane protein insertase YidC, partial [Gemmataceae bacterium]|nr:membrane protein insertase YidC [Gemmataceae bacterium]